MRIETFEGVQRAFYFSLTL